MTYHIIQLQEDSELEEVIPRWRESFAGDFDPLINMLVPIQGSSETAYETSIKDAVDRYTKSYRASKGASVWMKAVDDTTGKLLGATLWHFFDDVSSSTPSNQVGYQCNWFPAGEERDIANYLMAQFTATRVQYMREPYVFLLLAFTVPSARKRGIMSTLVHWGVTEADKRGHACYVSASPMGKSLYAKYGFVEGKSRNLVLAGFEETEAVRIAREKFLPLTWWPMYRPPGGVYEKGKTRLPWDM